MRGRERANLNTTEYSTPRSSSLQLPLHTRPTRNHRIPTNLLREKRAIVESSLARSAAETPLMPLPTHSLDILTNDWQSALQALRRPSLSTLRLAPQTPRIPILLNMAHALLERIPALRAEEVPEVPVRAQRDGMRADDGGCAVLASRREVLVPVQMAEVAESRIAVLSCGLAFDFWEDFAAGAEMDALEALGPVKIGLRTDF